MEYFYENNYQIFPRTYQADHEAKWEGRETPYEFDGQRYYLLKYDEYILYRRDHPHNQACTLFVPALKHDKKADKLLHSKWAFKKQVRGGRGGRFIFYNCRQAHGVAGLFFNLNGTGTFLDNEDVPNHGNVTSRRYEPREAIDFVWEDGKYGIPTFADILTCAPERLTPLCEDIIMEQVRPRMIDPYLSTEEYPDVPFGFACGSLEELLRITRCICHADSVLFETPIEDAFREAVSEEAYVKYNPTTPWRVDGLLQPTGYDKAESGRSSYVIEGSSLSENGDRLCELAFAHNAFHGAAWQITGYRDNKRPEKTTLKGMYLVVRVPPPSAHERAEALLALWDWLEGKVTEQERRALLKV